MLNYFWAVMIIIGVVYGALTGNIGAVGEAAFSSAREAIELCFTMAGVMAFWVGLMKIAERTGMVVGMTKAIRPFVHYMFPNIPEGHKAEQSISLNIIANVLGLGWAATPAGLEAMEALAVLEQERGNLEYLSGQENRNEKNALNGKRNGRNALGKKRSGGDIQIESDMPAVTEKGKKYERTATNEMCTFLILNISSLQLIPVNIIAYRSQYGSLNPTAVIAPAIVATFCSTAIAIVFCKMMDRRKKTECHKR